MGDETDNIPKTEAAAPKNAEAGDVKPKRIDGAQKAEGPTAIKFDGDLSVLFDKPLPQYDIGRNKAYQAESKSQFEGGVYALVCEKHHIPRRQAASKYATVTHQSLCQLLSYGKIYWEPAGQERFVFFYRNELGNPLLKPGQQYALGWSHERVMDAVVKPMIGVLRTFRDKEFFHGSIRPSNMFDGGVDLKDISHIKLGDALSTAAGYSQDPLFETIERAMADPVGRGKGGFEDDVYALGVSVAVLLRSVDPMANMSADDIIREKMKVGSYAALVSSQRFRSPALEFLRGVLHDDPNYRWGVDQLLSWQDGSHLTPKQTKKKKSATRPFTFCGEKFYQAPLLATALDVIPSETQKIVEDESLVQWLERSLDDDEAVQRTHEAIESSKTRSGIQDANLLVANLCSALDTRAPIRFQGLRLMGDGIGTALHEVMALKQDFKAFVDLFMKSVAMNWVTATENPNLDKTALIAQYDACRGFLRNKNMGYGIERCLYLLAPEAPCLSPKLADYCVFKPEDLLFAFDDMCAKGNAPYSFIDRHSAAFLSVYDSQCIDPFVMELKSPQEHTRLLGSLKCLANIQRRYGIKQVPALAATFEKMLVVILDRYRDQKTRQKIEGGLHKFAKIGDLWRMMGLVDDQAGMNKDAAAFKQALAEHKKLQKEYDELDEQTANNKEFGRDKGSEMAALTSGALAGGVIFITILLFFSRGGV